MKIGFVLLSDPRQPIPSTRVAVLNLLPLMAARGVQTEIVFAPEQPSETPELPPGLFGAIRAAGLDIVVFQKVRGPSVLQLVRQLQSAGVRTAYVVCDLVEPQMAEATDATVLVTDFLRFLYPAGLQHKLHVVHDGIERPQALRAQVSDHRGSASRPLRAVLVTSAALHDLPELVSPPDWLEVTIVGHYPGRNDSRARIARARWTLAELQGLGAKLDYLRFLSDPRIRREAWAADGVYDHLARADIGIIPIDRVAASQTSAVAAWQVKSENRLTLKMAMGLPVVATPIPAYLPVVEQGVNGFLATGRRQWLQALELLREPQARSVIGDAARSAVIGNFSLQAQAERLLAVLAGVVDCRRPCIAPEQSAAAPAVPRW